MRSHSGLVMNSISTAAPAARSSIIAPEQSSSPRFPLELPARLLAVFALSWRWIWQAGAFAAGLAVFSPQMVRSFSAFSSAAWRKRADMTRHSKPPMANMGTKRAL